MFLERERAPGLVMESCSVLPGIVAQRIKHVYVTEETIHRGLGYQANITEAWPSKLILLYSNRTVHGIIMRSCNLNQR